MLLMLSRKTLRIGVAICAPTLVVSALVLLEPGWIVGLLAKRSPEVVYFAQTR